MILVVYFDLEVVSVVDHVLILTSLVPLKIQLVRDGWAHERLFLHSFLHWLKGSVALNRSVVKDGTAVESELLLADVEVVVEQFDQELFNTVQVMRREPTVKGNVTVSEKTVVVELGENDNDADAKPRMITS